MHGMVRALVGTMVDIGRGSTRGEEFEAILNSHDRSTSGNVRTCKGVVPEGNYLLRAYVHV